jgi:hypothetical protein
MIDTYSIFFYGKTITAENRSFTFFEGAEEINASIPSGNYSMTAISQALSRALNNASSNNYVYGVTFNRNSLKLKISCNNLFGIKNSNLDSPLLTELGFEDDDILSTSEAEGTLPATATYEPQFLLQDYVSPEKNATMVSASELVSASGKTQVVRFGLKRELKLNIRWANNYLVDGGWIKQNPEAVEQLNDFMLHCVEKNIVELMPDLNERTDYYRMILVSTEESGDGTAYSLKERYDQDTPNYYDSGILTFRLVEA